MTEHDGKISSELKGIRNNYIRHIVIFVVVLILLNLFLHLHISVIGSLVLTIGLAVRSLKQRAMSSRVEGNV